MSDTSGDSSVGAECCAVDTALLDQNDIHSQDQKSDHTSDISSELDSDASSNEEDSSTTLVEATPMSKELGFVDVFATKTKMDEIYAWLKELVDDSTDDHVYIQKSTLRHQKRAVDSMRRCLRDAAPMAVKISQYMDASVKKTIETKVNKAITRMLNSEGASPIAMKDLLAQPTFKSQLLEDIEQEVLEDDDFPHERPSVLTSEIGVVVNFHLGRAFLKQAQKQTEAELLEKFNADKKKALGELRSAGLME